MTEEYESFGVAEPTESVSALVAAADKKKNAQRKGGKAAKSADAATARKPAAKTGKKAATPKRKPRKPAPKKSKQVTPAPSTGPGLLTRNVHRLADGVERVSGIGGWGWAAVLMVTGLVALGGFAWQRAPHSLAPKALSMINKAGEKVPEQLVIDMYKSYPRTRDLAQPDQAVLADFAQHLAGQQAIAAVDRVDVVYETGRRGLPRQVLSATVAVREPLLAVHCDDDVVRAVDAEGVFLPTMLRAPIDHPRVYGLGGAGRPALDELLALWPLLSQHVDPATIARIDLNGDLLRRDQRGLVFQLRSGVTVLWGMPGEARFGIDNQHKVKQLLHALQCQGEETADTVIDVRFDQARYVSTL